MQKHNLQDLIEFGERKFLRKVLIGEPGFHLVLLNLHAAQRVPGHSTSAEIRTT